ncbi:Adenosine 5'-monophosphoramidase [Mycoemilia scoparia]|uniref:Adenosine 5'-monophosphoramidase n=1 Tax=Mycoemilia scoparia TaxID=417184 RepID=A0A9W7ZRE1_9FUNG|nr:Adenosine 5'-monophosphoramidase [Mycoemilia scoparia]
MHELPDEYLADILVQAKKVVNVLGPENYNILQNNGRLAHQEVDHVHFHIIPKPNKEEGLVIGWPSSKADIGKLSEYAKELSQKL